MKKKLVFTVFTVYLMFLAILYWYLFLFHDGRIPPELVGTSADPATFLSDGELERSERFSKIRDFLFFSRIPYEWIFYFFLLFFGGGKGLERLAENSSRFSLVKNAVFTFLLSLLTFAVFFPVRLVQWFLSKSYGISVQPFSAWMRDRVIDFWVDFLLLFLIVTAVLWFIRKREEKWWLYAWLASIPFAVFFMFIQPVIIDPLYNEFVPLQNEDLEGKILMMAREAGIPSEHVFEVDMSSKTNALNAYVTGIGDHSRIVLWDTVIERLDDEEILFIMAHEMAHYVEKHIYIGIGGYLLLLLVGLFLAAKLMKGIVRKYGNILHVDSVKSLAAFPLLLLIVSVLSFAASPLTNAASRYQEMRADRYAIEQVENVDAGISAFQALTKSGLSQVHPPALVKWFRYGHPTMKERIQFIEGYRDRFDNR